MGDLIGTSVRSIRLTDRLGTGGMGEVYLGEDERLKRQVAVKAIRSDTRMTPTTKARFLREAQILSRLEHPNICRVYDYIEGEDNDFLVLELVAGRSLRQAIDEGLSAADKATISVQIARALVAAHSMSVVHRDLKPENIMLGPEGEVKVLDFGLARSMTPSDTTESGAHVAEPSTAGTDSDAVTRAGDIMGTPRYMSPEQARGEPVTAASDMYSLGLVLQELFTGRSPYPVDIHPAALMQKIIWGDTLEVRDVDPDLAELINRLKAQSPADRPAAESAAARLGWIWDKPRRRTRRMVVAGVAASLLIAAVSSTAGLLHARRSLERARQAQAQAEAVNTFLRQMLASADPGEDGRNVRVIDVLDRASAEIATSFTDHPLHRASVLHTLGVTYQALGLYDAAYAHMSEAVALRRQLLGVEHADTLTSMNSLANVLRKLGRLDEAETLHRETLEASRRALGEDHIETIRSMGNLANALYRRGDTAEALDLARETFERKRRVLGAEHKETLATAGNLAVMLRAAGQVGEAEALLRETLAIERRVLGDEHPMTLAALGALSTVFLHQQRFDDALELARETLTIRQRVLGEEHPDTLVALSNLAVVLRAAGRLDEAEPIARRAWAAARSIRGDDHLQTLAAQENLAAVVEDLGRPDEAVELYAACLESRRRTQGDESPETLQTILRLAMATADRGQPAEARVMVERALAVARETLADDHPVTAALDAGLERLAAGQS